MYYSDVNLCVSHKSMDDMWWFNARKSCLMDGGHLVYINSDAEYERLKEYIRDWMIYNRDVKGVCVCGGGRGGRYVCMCVGEVKMCVCVIVVCVYVRACVCVTLNTGQGQYN